MKKYLLGLLLLTGCGEPDHSNNPNHFLILDVNKCLIVEKPDERGSSVASNLQIFIDSYGNRFFVSDGKIMVVINDNQWEAAARELRINLMDCGKIK